jgi:ribosomal protein L37AE/L43A
MPKKSKPVEPEPVKVEEVEEEQVTCPVCGKPVGLDVATCPNCGAEFEEEAVETEEVQPEEAVVPAASPKDEVQPVSEEEIAECPVCGKSVALSLSTCPNCGAEFEEEEVEEVIEVEEKEVSTEEIEVEEQDEVRAEENESSITHPTSVLDLRVLGVALIILGIIGLQIAAFINWYWTWVPPIRSNLGMFIGVAAVVIVVGLLVYMISARRIEEGKDVPAAMPNLMLSLFLFGIMALILIMFWSQINSALQHSNLGVAGAFIGILIVGILAMIMGQRIADKDTLAAEQRS